MTRVRLYMLVIVMLSCMNACVADKVTVDPNAGLAPTSAEVGKTDPRLAQKVTYEAWHTPTKTILADLSKKTGVTFHTGYNLNDWRVRDRKMNIRVKGVSLAQLMNSIARVMKFKWSINDKKQPPTYRLLMDYRLLAKLQAEASKRENELKSEETRRRTELLDALAKVADASGSELAALKESNPYLYICAETGFAKLMTTIFTERPAYRETFTGADGNSSPGMKYLPPETPQLCASVLHKVSPLDKVWCDRQQLPDDLGQQTQTCSVIMEMTPSPYEYSLRQQLSDFGNIGTVVSTGYHKMGWLKDANAKSTQTWARAILAAQDQGIGNKGYYSQFANDVDNAEKQDAEEIEYYFMFDPVAEQADEPDLHRITRLKVTDEIKKVQEEQLKASGYQAAQRISFQTDLRLIADATALNIVSDSFAVVVGDLSPGSKNEELRDVLDTFADSFGCNWEKHGSMLEVRRRDWFRRRSSQIPDGWIEPWREEVDRTDTLAADTYFRIAVLEDDQLEENICTDKVLGPMIGDSFQRKNIKGFGRFFLQLTSDQRSQLYSKQGLEPSTLSADQWHYYADMFTYGRRFSPAHTDQYLDLTQGPITIAGERTTSEDSSYANYSFKVTRISPDGKPHQDHWDMVLPVIAHPKEKGK